ncbi:Na/Pi cotransporter family protein [Stieleria mannarensis]|uniref:Na/Pi cotransporter family protein n=1 Tax=Stieleria mannarensis TaxID=2755585 RepID=UPI001C723279|nr:Na/Pi cotransporter family protein [Rhodopirellula sp. JC639]
MLAEVTSDALQFGPLLTGLIGGLALFLFGLDQMSESLKMIAGDGLKKVLATLTTNRFTGAVAGSIVTAVVQSSSVTTVLVVGFISAGLMTLTQSIGVIMGANIGSTFTAQLIAFKVTHYSLLLVATGFFLQFASRHDGVRYYGQLIMGSGLIFFGMQLMSDGTEPLRSYRPFIEMMHQMDRPFLGILVAAIFTAIVQSSAATTGLVIALAGQGFVSLDAGIALIFGANIGTCITAGLASIGKPREAVRAALAHVVFNIAGVAIWFAFIPELSALVQWVSPQSPELSGLARVAAETPRQIANAHTVFNVANTFMLIWFTTPMVWLVKRLVPEKPVSADRPGAPKYLDPLLLQTPALAVDVVRLELGRLGAAALHMMRGALHTIIHGSRQQVSQLHELDNHVDELHGAIVTYLGRLSQENLSDHQSEQLHEFLSVANYLESIGDMIESNLVEAGRDRIANRLMISKQTEAVLEALNREVIRATERAIESFVSGDVDSARIVLEAKSTINALADQAEVHLSGRLIADAPNRLAMYRLESEIMEYLKRMFYFAKRIAKLTANGRGRETEVPPQEAAENLDEVRV